MAITSITCPVDCDTLVLPPVSFDDCEPQVKLSEFAYAYLALKDAAEFDDASQPTEWANRLSADSTIPEGSDAQVVDLIRQLNIVGDMPAPSATEKDISGGRKIVTRTDRTVNLDIDEATALNYELTRSTECGYFKVRMWFETRGGILLGGNAGITGRLVLRPIFGRGVDEIEKYTGTFTWTNNTSPDRCVSPLAH
jgi:hypothetical protein